MAPLRSLIAAGAFASALLPSVSATLLYVSSYGGTVTTFNLTSSGGGSGNATTLKSLGSNTDCLPDPAWLTLDHHNSTLYCLGEGITKKNGTLVSYRTSDNGSLAQLDRVGTIQGPVSGAIYGHGGRGLALAQYLGSSLSTFSIADPKKLSPIQAETFKLSGPGTDPARQDAPHPHEAIIDPTGRFLLAPDLGADLVRIYRLDLDTLQRTAVEPLAIKPGRGPRHGVFLVTKTKTLFFLVTELTSNIISYEVGYGNNSTLSFKELSTTTSHGNATVPEGATAAEIQLSPDGRFLIVSSRGEGTLEIPNFDPSNSTKIASDPLMSFSVDHDTGVLTPVQTVPAGGISPRHFSLNKAGDLVAVGLRDDRVVVIRRDVKTGKLGDFVAHAYVQGEVTCSIFDE